MAFNEKLNKILEELRRKKPFDYDIIFTKNSKFKKQNILFQVKLKALLMEEKNVDLWWDVVQDIIQKDIGKVYRKYERIERLYKHKIFYMEKVMPSFEYDPLVLFLEPETIDEKEYIGDIDGARPLGTRPI